MAFPLGLAKAKEEVWAWTTSGADGGRKRAFALLTFEEGCITRSISSPSTGQASPTRKILGYSARSEILLRSMKRKRRFSIESNKIMRSCSAPANFIFHQIRDIPARRLHESSELEVMSWNIASPSNNPFEYWVTHELSDYDEVMKTVQSIIDNPEERSATVMDIFSHQMFAELRTELARSGVTELDVLDDIWKNDISQRRAIPGFLEDHTLGDKRLISMPDRVTNSVQVCSASK
jgi:hypothetical protein